MSAERVRAARELLGLSQADLAVAADISQPLISQIERGNRDLSEEVLAAVIRGTGLPRSFFEVVEDDSPLDSLRFRKFKTASATVTVRSRRTFREMFRISKVLMDEVRLPVPDLPIVDASTQVTDGFLEALALDTRTSLGLSIDEPVRHVTRAAERAGVAVAPLIIPGVSEEDASGHFGISGCAGIHERAAIGFFPSSGDRQRFTLAHELGHLVLHTHRRRVEDRDAESEANRFASAFLLPLRPALDLFTARATLYDYGRLKADWGVSIAALIMRSHAVDAISEERRTSLFKQLSARGWRKSEPVTVPVEHPALLGTLLQRRFREERNPYKAAEESLRLTAVQLRSLLPLPQPSGQLETAKPDATVLTLRQG